MMLNNLLGFIWRYNYIAPLGNGNSITNQRDRSLPQQIRICFVQSKHSKDRYNNWSVQAVFLLAVWQWYPNSKKKLFNSLTYYKAEYLVTKWSHMEEECSQFHRTP